MRSRADRATSAVRLFALALATCVGLAACSSNGGEADRPTVEVFGPIVGEPGRQLADAMQRVSEDAPVELRYVGVTSFNEQLEDRLQRGDQPGIALVPQPGVLSDLAERGLAAPLPSDVQASLADAYPDQLASLLRVDGQMMASWLSVDLKSIVWYRADEFEARGLEVPTTFDELLSLTDRVRREGDGVAPWCLPMEAGASTGWVGTDWVEDQLVRRLGVDAYRQWTSGELSFEDPRVVEVFDQLDRLLRRPGSVAGGSRAILTTPWERAAAMLSSDPPSCLMNHQGDFLRREFSVDVDLEHSNKFGVFLYPSLDGDLPPLTVGGMLAVPIGDSGDVQEAVRLITSTEFAGLLNDTGSFLSPDLRAPVGEGSDAADLRSILELSAEIVFDGSDLMPARVGTGTFWTGMRSFFAGESIDAVVAEIQAGWSRPPA